MVGKRGLSSLPIKAGLSRVTLRRPGRSTFQSVHAKDAKDAKEKDAKGAKSLVPSRSCPPPVPRAAQPQSFVRAETRRRRDAEEEVFALRAMVGLAPASPRLRVSARTPLSSFSSRL